MSERSGVGRTAEVQELPSEALAQALRAALCGPDHVGAPEVIWNDRGAQILLHVGKLQVHLAKATVVVAVDTESVEFGIAPLIVRFAFGPDGGPTSLIAATDASALGHPQVAARWGDLFRDVIWAAIARLVATRSGGAAPGGLTVRPGTLAITVQPAFSAVDLAVAHVRGVEGGVRPGRGPARPEPPTHRTGPRVPGGPS